MSSLVLSLRPSVGLEARQRANETLELTCWLLPGQTRLDGPSLATSTSSDQIPSDSHSRDDRLRLEGGCSFAVPVGWPSLARRADRSPAAPPRCPSEFLAGRLPSIRGSCECNLTSRYDSLSSMLTSLSPAAVSLPAILPLLQQTMRSTSASPSRP